MEEQKPQPKEESAEDLRYGLVFNSGKMGLIMFLCSRPIIDAFNATDRVWCIPIVMLAYMVTWGLGRDSERMCSKLARLQEKRPH